jgi:GST-like protein
MTYTLYGCRCSGSAIIEMALSRINVPYEEHSVDLSTEEQRGDAYAAVNPQRKIPALQTPAGELLTESVAILLTLDERHRNAALLPPPGTPERAQALRWMIFVATELYPLVEINDYPERFAPRAEDAPAIRDIARARWRERWLVVEQAIEGDPWLLRHGFNAADMYIAVVSRWAQQKDWRPGHVPRIEAIAAAIAQQPDVGAVWKRHFG